MNNAKSLSKSTSPTDFAWIIFTIPIHTSLLSILYSPYSLSLFVSPLNSHSIPSHPIPFFQQTPPLGYNQNQYIQTILFYPPSSSFINFIAPAGARYTYISRPLRPAHSSPPSQSAPHCP